MKALILSTVAVAAFLGTASAGVYNEQTGTILERRMNAQGQTFFVHVRPAQQTTTVALHRRGHGLGDRHVTRVERDRALVAERHEDQHGRTTVRYRTAR